MTEAMRESDLRKLVQDELRAAGRTMSEGKAQYLFIDDKEAIRQRHESQRRERALHERAMIEKHGGALLDEFAAGIDVSVEAFSPKLVPVEAGTWEGLVFRFASLLWSVPVSPGYGRRMRYLIRDSGNQKLVGLLAFMDPVFNLHARDAEIGWSSDQRKQRLYHVMDANVLGAVPPYDRLLGGKFIALAAVTDEIRHDFAEKYRGQVTEIQKARKQASLVLVTTTSALGRSSIYNRLQLPGEAKRVYRSVGYSGGWGHFQVSEGTFRELRSWLRERGDEYADGHRYGMGPNWRLRTIRRALDLLGIDGDPLKHGIKREVFLAPLASNYREFLLGEAGRPTYYHRSLEGITEFFKRRWMLPRSLSTADWKSWMRADTWARIAQNCGLPLNLPLL